ncbi:hypothetical protein NQ318_004952 [Aromia moschata]|uniref:Phage protein n=1 Tax=Aromia moschata TaxID=1265417 RepID=A0AAV8X0V5_9CUCU|nr:hypothetical protein NQ318_004952 [Aromia moschata]
MDLDEIKVVYTCWQCEVIVDEITDNPCIEGYGHIYVDNNHYFYPVLDDGKTIIRRSQLDDHKEGVVECIRDK